MFGDEESSSEEEASTSSFKPSVESGDGKFLFVFIHLLFYVCLSFNPFCKSIYQWNVPFSLCGTFHKIHYVERSIFLYMERSFYILWNVPQNIYMEHSI
jgi:hypothetical protein